MDHIQDLKKLRDDALSRLQNNPDYRTLRALTVLIDDLTLMDNPRSQPLSNLPGVDSDDEAKEDDNKGPGRVANFSAKPNVAVAEAS